MKRIFDSIIENLTNEGKFFLKNIEKKIFDKANNLKNSSHNEFLKILLMDNVELIKDYNKKIDLQYKDYEIIKFCCERNYIDSLEYLINFIDPKDKKWKLNIELGISWAANNGNLLIVKYLIEKKIVEINAMDKKLKNSPIICSCLNGHKNVIEYLIMFSGMDLKESESSILEDLKDIKNFKNIDIYDYTWQLINLKFLNEKIKNKFNEIYHDDDEKNKKEKINKV